MIWLTWDAMDGTEDPGIYVAADSPRDAAIEHAERDCRRGLDDGVYGLEGGHPIAVRLPYGGGVAVYLVGYVGPAVPPWPGDPVEEKDPVMTALAQASAADAEVYLSGRVPK